MMHNMVSLHLDHSRYLYPLSLAIRSPETDGAMPPIVHMFQELRDMGSSGLQQSHGHVQRAARVGPAVGTHPVRSPALP